MIPDRTSLHNFEYELTNKAGDCDILIGELQEKIKNVIKIQNALSGHLNEIKAPIHYPRTIFIGIITIIIEILACVFLFLHFQDSSVFFVVLLAVTGMTIFMIFDFNNINNENSSISDLNSKFIKFSQTKLDSPKDILDMNATLDQIRKTKTEMVANIITEITSLKETLKQENKLQLLELLKKYEDIFETLELNHTNQINSISSKERIEGHIRECIAFLRLYSLIVTAQSMKSLIDKFRLPKFHQVSLEDMNDEIYREIGQIISVSDKIIGYFCSTFDEDKKLHYWSQIKGNDHILKEFIIHLLENYGDNSLKNVILNTNVSLHLKQYSTFSYDSVIMQLRNITKDVLNISTFCNFLEEKSFDITFSDNLCYEILVDFYFKRLKDSEHSPKSPRFSIYEQILEKCIILNNKCQIEDNKALYAIFIIYLHESMLSMMLEKTIQNLTQNSIVTKVLWLWVDSEDSSNSLISFYQEISTNIIENQVENNKALYNEFVKSLQAGLFIVNIDILFNKLMKNRQKVVKTLLTNREITDHRTPLTETFKFAIERIFQSKVRDPTFFKLLTFQKSLKPYLLTFQHNRSVSPKGGIQEFIDKVLPVDLTSKYTGSARLGILGKEFPTLQDVKEKLPKEIQLQIYKDRVATTIDKFIEISDKLKNYFPTAVTDQLLKRTDLLKRETKTIEHNLKFQEYFQEYKKCIKNIIEDALMELEQNNESSKFNSAKTDYEEIDRIIIETIPEYQVLLHRIADSYHTLKWCGTYVRHEPLETIKKLYAKYFTYDQLIANFNFDEEITIERTLEVIFTYLTFADLVIGIIPVVKQNTIIAEKLGEKNTVIMLSKILNIKRSEKCNIINFAYYIIMRTKIKIANSLTFDEFLVEYDKWKYELRTNIEDLASLLLEKLGDDAEEDLCKQISETVIHVTLCICFVYLKHTDQNIAKLIDVS